jgi:ubiquinone/menaquinone biosynthesis C-methylase UbiE
MSSEAEVYQKGADEYDLLIAREDYQHNISTTLKTLFQPEGLDILDLGAGTGRLSSLFARNSRSLIAFDASLHMLQSCYQKFKGLGKNRNWTVTADHRYIPLPRSSADIILSGWSISYLASWDPAVADKNLDQWLSEAHRVLRSSGLIILLESLGTGNSHPILLDHMTKFYDWLDEQQFRHTWIRTDYRFKSLDEAVRLTDFFYGREMADTVGREHLIILPECTGIWWMEKAAEG